MESLGGGIRNLFLSYMHHSPARIQGLTLTVCLRAPSPSWGLVTDTSAPALSSLGLPLNSAVDQQSSGRCTWPDLGDTSVVPVCPPAFCSPSHVCFCPSPLSYSLCPPPAGEWRGPGQPAHSVFAWSSSPANSILRPSLLPPTGIWEAPCLESQRAVSLKGRLGAGL